MKAIKHILALCLSLLMIVSMIVSTGAMTASAIAGGGLPTTYYRSYGVDLSSWNGTVNFTQLKASGCQFAILRLGYEGSSSRTDTLDKNFLTYYNNARAAGMPLGIYFYSLATTYAGAKQDAQWVMSIIEKYDMYFEFPIYYDVEDSEYTYQTSLSSAKMEQLCLGWCETLEAAGYFPGIYGGGSQVIDKLSSNFKSRYDLWYPRYASMDASNQFSSNYKDYSYYCGIWQYAVFNNSTYSGLSSNTLDKNVCYKDYPSVIKKYGYNNCGMSAKDTLGASIDAAKSARYDHYTESALTTLRSTYTEAVALYNNSAATNDQLTAMSSKLDAAVKNTVKNLETNASKGKTYTAPASGRTDQYVDDGKRLTDGTKGTENGGTDKYSGFSNASPVSVVVDLGSSVSTNTYRIYTAMNEGWGISLPPKFSVSVSNDGKTYTEVGSSAIKVCTNSSDTWSTYTYTLTTNITRNERYIKFTVENGSNHVWLEEVEACLAPIAATGRLYVTGVNKYVTSGATVIFTPDQGEITTSKCNHSYTTNIIATKNGSNYVVTSVTEGSGPDTPAITLGSNQILIAVHGWEASNIDSSILGSAANQKRAKALAAGDVLTLTNIDVANKAVSAAPSIEITKKITEPVERPDDAKVFWVTHVNDNTSEGTGTILTVPYTGAAWWLHVAFAPTNNGSYKITAISNGIVDGSAKPLDIPAGGFVYAVNKGNNYIDLGLGDTDYTSANCDNALEDALNWKVGDEFAFYGIDPINPIVCTTTPSLVWYDDKYVCTSYYKQLNAVEEPPVVEPEIALGDVNADGVIDQFDYILVKRHYFETRLLTDDELLRADVNVDGVIDQFDYILISRHYFGSYVIG